MEMGSPNANGYCGCRGCCCEARRRSPCPARTPGSVGGRYYRLVVVAVPGTASVRVDRVGSPLAAQALRVVALFLPMRDRASRSLAIASSTAGAGGRHRDGAVVNQVGIVLRLAKAGGLNVTQKFDQPQDVGPRRMGGLGHCQHRPDPDGFGRQLSARTIVFSRARTIETLLQQALSESAINDLGPSAAHAAPPPAP